MLTLPILLLSGLGGAVLLGPSAALERTTVLLMLILEFGAGSLFTWAVLTALRQESAASRAPEKPRRGRPPRVATGLDAETTRKRGLEAKNLLGKGLTFKQIAARLDVEDPRTVRRWIGWVDEDDAAGRDS